MLSMLGIKDGSVPEWRTTIKCVLESLDETVITPTLNTTPATLNMRKCSGIDALNNSHPTLDARQKTSSAEKVDTKGLLVYERSLTIVDDCHKTADCRQASRPLRCARECNCSGRRHDSLGRARAGQLDRGKKRQLSLPTRHATSCQHPHFLCMLGMLKPPISLCFLHLVYCTRLFLCTLSVLNPLSQDCSGPGGESSVCQVFGVTDVSNSATLHAPPTPPLCVACP